MGELRDHDCGTYTLVVKLAGHATIRFGAAGTRDLETGWYAYTGSAFGPGGFARVSRHRELATGDRGVRHWHVDYLLGHEHATIEDVIRSPGEAIECRVAAELGGEPVTGVGASDCDCESHLTRFDDRASLHSAAAKAHV